MADTGELVRHSTLFAAASVALMTLAGCDAPKAPVEPKPVAPPTAAEQAAAQELLKATATKYALAKTYQDEGVVAIVLDTEGDAFKDRKPFSTAFERDGRFRWEFKSSVQVGGKLDQRYVVWSKDGKSFKSTWTIQPGKLSEFESIVSAMAGPTGVSSGSATVVIPLLQPGFNVRYQTTDLTDAALRGSEMVDGVECTIVHGKQAIDDADVTLWIDGDHAIRKLRALSTVNPASTPAGSPSTEKAFKVEKVITIKPLFDAEIPDAAFQGNDATGGASGTTTPKGK